MPQASGTIQEFFFDSGEFGRRVKRTGSGSKALHLREGKANKLNGTYKILRSPFVMHRQLFASMNRVQHIGLFRTGRRLTGQLVPQRYGVLVIASPLCVLRQFASRAWPMFGGQSEIERL